MKTTSLVFSILVSIILIQNLSTINCELVAKDNIYYLTLTTYNEAKKNLNPLVILYSNQDRVSRKFLPEFQKFVNKAQRDRALKDIINFAIVNSTTQAELAQKLEIKAYPTIFLFKDKGATKLKYKSFWTAHDVEQWVKLNVIKVRRASKEIKSTDQMQRRQMMQKNLVAFFGTTPDTPESELFLDIAEAKKEYFYSHTYDLQTRQDFGIKDPNQQKLVIFSRQQKHRYQYTYQGNLTDEQNINFFLKVYHTPGLLEVESNVMYNRIFQTQWSGSLFFAYNKSIESHKWAADEIRKLRESLFKKISIGIFDVDSADPGHSFYQDFMMTHQITPTLTFIDHKDGKGQQYMKNLHLKTMRDLVRDAENELQEDKDGQATETEIEKVKFQAEKQFFQDKLSSEAILDFIQKAQDGVLQRIVKSEQIPQKNNGIIQVLVRDTFEQFLNTEGKDVLVLFTTIQSTECEELYKVLETVAHKLNNNPNLIFGTINMHLNEIDDMEALQKFPVLKLYTATDKRNSVDIMFQTQVSSLIEFLQTTVTVPWVEPLSDQEIENINKQNQAKQTDL